MLYFSKTEVKMIYILAGLLGIGIFCYAIISVPKSKEEQRLDDEEQMEYLKQYREQKNKTH